MMSESTLTYQVYVAPIIAMAGKDIPPGQSRSTWSPISATLISGRHDAVLVDPLMTVEQGMAVADWVSTTGRTSPLCTSPTGTVTTGSGSARSATASPACHRGPSCQPPQTGSRTRQAEPEADTWWRPEHYTTPRSPGSGTAIRGSAYVRAGLAK